MFSNFFFGNRAFYEIKLKAIVEPARPQIRIRRMCISRWVPKATNTHSEYVILIAFPLQQWLHERASVLHLRTWPILFLLLYVSTSNTENSDWPQEGRCRTTRRYFLSCCLQRLLMTPPTVRPHLILTSSRHIFRLSTSP